MAKTQAIEVRIIDADAVQALLATVNLALGDARAWLDPQTPQWVRDAVDRAFEQTYPAYAAAQIQAMQVE